MDRAESMKKVEEILASEDAKNLSEEEKKAVAENIKKMIDGEILQKVLGFSDEMMNFFYGETYRLFNGGHYEKAAQYFQYLIQLNPNDPRYLMGYAACKMKLNENLEAIAAYGYLHLLDQTNPFFPFYLGNLYRKLGRLYASAIYYAIVIDICGDDPEMEKLKERAKLNIEALKNEGALL